MYYVWQCLGSGASNIRGDVSEGEHLTTFVAPDSTYRALTIPLPQVRAGQKWRLGLFSGEQSAARRPLDNVLSNSENVEVIGVWSEPIAVITGSERGSRERESKKAKLDKPKGNGKEKEKEKDDAPKQNRIHREWLLDDSADHERVLRIIEQTSYDLDKVCTLLSCLQRISGEIQAEVLMC